MKYILKSSVRFNFPRGFSQIELHQYKKIFRNNAHTGASSVSYGEYWFCLPKGKAIFKTYDDSLSYTKYLRITNELLCQEIAKNMGVKCANYERASYHEREGLLSYNIAGKDETIISVYDLLVPNYTGTASDIFEVAYQHIRIGYKLDEKQFYKDVFNMLLFDTLTFQSDRHLQNIFFTINSKEKYIKLSPLLDNELAFGGIVLFGYLDDNSDMVDKHTKKSFIQAMERYTSTIKMHMEKESYKDKIKFLITYAQKTNNIAYLEDTLKNLNIQKCLDSIKNQGVEFNEEYEQLVKQLVTIVKTDLKKEIKQQTAQQDSNNDLQI